MICGWTKVSQSSWSLCRSTSPTLSCKWWDRIHLWPCRICVIGTFWTHDSIFQSDYFMGKCFNAMSVDSLSSSHPISTPVENPAEISEMFDDVSYQKVHKQFLLNNSLHQHLHVFWVFFSHKGACILNMLRDFLSPEAFKYGIILYLKKHSYRNTVNSDLWESLTNVSDSSFLCVFSQVFSYCKILIWGQMCFTLVRSALLD